MCVFFCVIFLLVVFMEWGFLLFGSLAVWGSLTEFYWDWMGKLCWCMLHGRYAAGCYFCIFRSFSSVAFFKQAGKSCGKVGKSCSNLFIFSLN